MSNTRMTMPRKLREGIANGLVLAAGCYDPFTARLAEMAGFQAIHLTGYGHEITQIGAPDLGIQTLTELAMQSARMTDCIDIPIIADVDTGFGGVLNVRRTIRELERAGIAGVHLEDQTFPKRCPSIGGVKTVSRQDAVDRIKAAVDAKRDPDFMIVARCDTDMMGFDELIERCNLYLEAGADMVMPMFLNLDGISYFKLTPDEQMERIKKVVKAINGPVMSMGTPPPMGYTVKDMEEVGYSFSMFAAHTLTAVANAVHGLFESIIRTGNCTEYESTHKGPYDDGSGIAAMKAVHFDDYLAFEKIHITE